MIEMQDLVRRLLAALGEDPGREGLLETPRRVEKSLQFLTSGYKTDIDALINGMDAGSVKTAGDAPPPPGTVVSFDFMNQMRIVRGRMPTLEMINERFARLFRVNLYNLLRRSPEVAVNPVDENTISAQV
jgi:hypothetical protein